MSSGAEAGIVLLVSGCVTTVLFIVGILRREKTGGCVRWVPPPDPAHARLGPLRLGGCCAVGPALCWAAATGAVLPIPHAGHKPRISLSVTVTEH